MDGLARIVRDENYHDVDGGILEALGRLFPDPTVAYVYPNGGDGGDSGRDTTLDTLPIADHLRPLLAYLRERGVYRGGGRVRVSDGRSSI